MRFILQKGFKYDNIIAIFCSLYLIYPRCAPVTESNSLKLLQEALPRIEPGDERSFEMQAIFQLTGLVTTLFIALITGSFTGEPIKIQFF